MTSPSPEIGWLEYWSLGRLGFEYITPSFQFPDHGHTSLAFFPNDLNFLNVLNVLNLFLFYGCHPPPSAR
jgi:hypothetical protein